MYRNETLQLEGDSIWGRITLLLSSLIGRPCTGSERAQFYEEIPLQSMIDKAIVVLNKNDGEYRIKKFFSLTSKLREATDSSEEILRFLLLLSRVDDNYADKSQTDTSPCCSGSQILNVWKQTVKNYLPTSAISENHTVTSTRPFTDRTNIPFITYQSHYEDNKEIAAENQPCHSEEKTELIDISPSKCSENYEKVRGIVIDERGRIHPRACDPELRSLCNLRIGDVFYIISWHEYLRCLAHVLMGEESILFRRNADGFFIISKRNKMFLELEDVNLLPRLALPFLTFANRLLSLEQFVHGSDSVEDFSILDCKTQENAGTRVLLSLKLCASERLWKFRDEVRHYIDAKKECDSENIRRLLRELLDMCSVFSHFVDLVLHVQNIGAQDAKTLLDIFYIVKITKGRILPAIREFCDDVLVVLLRYYAECVLFWLVKGEANPRDGVFSFSKMDSEMLQWTVSGEKESINLEASMLIAKNLVDVWLSEGKFRKLMLAWSNLKHMDSEESNCVTINKLISELSEEEIRKALSSDLLGAVGSLLDFYFQKVYLSQHATFARCSIIDDFKQTAKLLQDVYLCDDEHITEIFTSLLLNGDDSELNFKYANCQNFRLDNMTDYLLTKNYSSTLVHGFLELTSSFDEEDNLKVRYKPPFPLNIIFTPSILMNYERIWNLLLRTAVECITLEYCPDANANVEFCSSSALFFHEQIGRIIVNEYQVLFDVFKFIYCN
ncbi:hypothetical protein LOAG_09278 [Loa loa]|uniref:Uncharacterized protein n=1 Tax=Loa loa TaxID=7209 RepID=A0A1S0TS20_LOALO|nr:hypothetical protein LOAG_09278 [Loa loa]EFO19212.2 hypothetical protein LOAG_09278 [Loa loa]